MKILNVSESTIFLDDINTIVVYSRNKKPVEIDDKLAKKSKSLKFALSHNMLVDVTNGIPSVLPKPKGELEIAAEQEADKDPSRKSLFDKRKEIFVTDEPKLDRPSPPQAPRESAKRDAFREYREDGKMSIVWTGPTCDAGGYAAMNRKFMFGLSDAGVDVSYDHLVSMNDMDPGTMSKINSLKAKKVPPNAPKIYGMTAPLIYSWDRYKMLFTMMETRRLHPDYAERCNCADEIVVPSFWCKKTFEESGVKKPIHVVPLGVDTSIYYPDAEPLNFSAKLKDYVFLSVFGWSMRKGYDVLLQAYLEEFTSKDDVSLLISSRYFGSTDESKKQVIRDDIARVSSMVENQDKPHVVLFGDVLSIDLMPRLYASADCYVLPSRGEGFGLPYIEAGACRMPVIATRYSGQTDFLDDDNSYLVDIDGFRVADESLSWISYFYENAEFPILGPGVVEQTRAAMRRAYENQEEARTKAGKLYDKVVTEYDWSVCVNQMHDKLKRTFDQLSGA